MIYLTNVNLNQNELQNAVIQPLAVAPVSAKLGQIYTDSVTGKIKQFNGSVWKTVGVVVESSETNGNIVVDGVEMQVYRLPIASDTTLGGVKIGKGFKIDATGTLIRDVAYYTGIRGVDETDDAVFTRVLNGVVPSEGDVFVIKTLIANDKYSYSSFIYDEGKWCAMDGNVDARNVILRSDIITAGDYTQVGNITKAKTATGSIAVTGKSVEDAFVAIFTKELNPTKTEPSISITEFPVGSHEVGTVVTTKWKASLTPGSYTYGPATGITATSWKVTDTEGNSSTEATGQFDNVTVGDDTAYEITIEATHGAGAIPLTNLKNEYPDAQIAEGTKTKKSGSVSGFRSFFYGASTTVLELTSDNIRSLTNANKAVGESQTIDPLNLPEGTKQVIIAFPTSANKNLTKVLDANAFGTDIVGSFNKSVVAVEGANGYTAVDYDVWVYAPEAALGANTYTVTIS